MSPSHTTENRYKLSLPKSGLFPSVGIAARTCHFSTFLNETPSSDLLPLTLVCLALSDQGNSTKLIPDSLSIPGLAPDKQCVSILS